MLKNLSVWNFALIENANIEFDEGLNILTGETGAGKTTTALSILRILPNPPAKVLGGKVIFKDRDIFQLSEREMRAIRGEEIAMIFQDPMTSLDPVKTVGDQICEMILLHQHCSKKEAWQKAGDMLETVGIDRERAGEYPHQFIHDPDHT